MPITVGEVTVVADKSFDVYSVSLSKQSGAWKMYIEYAVIVGDQRTDRKIVLEGEDYNNFYATWLSGKQIVDKVIEVESANIVVTEEVAEDEFINDIPEPTEEVAE